MKNMLNSILPALICCSFMTAQTLFETDTIKTVSGDLAITFIAHSSLRFDYRGQVIYVDPSSYFADFSGMPAADYILITHEHYDHLDTLAVQQLEGEKTKIIGTSPVSESLPSVDVMANGDTLFIGSVMVEAVPAYNRVHRRSNGDFFHPKGVGNGYVLTFANIKVYIAGDTENIPEMKNLKDIDIAFLPMNLPYTMTPEMVADAVDLFHPKILYPYHTGETDINELIKLMKDRKDCEVRVRKLK